MSCRSWGLTYRGLKENKRPCSRVNDWNALLVSDSNLQVVSDSNPHARHAQGARDPGREGAGKHDRESGLARLRPHNDLKPGGTNVPSSVGMGPRGPIRGKMNPKTAAQGLHEFPLYVRAVPKS